MTTRKSLPRPWLQVFHRTPLRKNSSHPTPTHPHSVSSDSDPDKIEIFHRQDLPHLERSIDSDTTIPPAKKRFSSATPAHKISDLGASLPKSVPTQNPLTRIKPWATTWRWQLIWLAIFGTLGGTMVLAIVWLSKVPPAVDCQRIASTWGAVDSERLYCAQQAAQNGNPEQLLAAIAIVKDWTSEHPLYSQGQVLLQDWSNGLLIIARDRVSQRDTKGGIRLASQIPVSSPSYKDAQAAIERWQEEYRKGEALYYKIQTDLKQQAWNRAVDHTSELSLINDPDWQDRLLSVRQQIKTEKSAWQQLQVARSFAKTNPPENLGQAIALTQPIPRKTYAWTLHAQGDVAQWRDRIFKLATTQLDRRNLSATTTLINSVPTGVQLLPAHHDLIRLVRGQEIVASKGAQAMALESLPYRLLITHLVGQIPDRSPFHGRAKTLLPQLEQQTQDRVQLNLAGSLANLQQIPTLHWAIAQAQAITPNRPERLDAQTLVAQWQKEVQSLEDRPTLRQAEQMAKAGKLDALQGAVALAATLPAKRALHAEAQTNIADWISQIQVIEDRPILSEARAYAQDGSFNQAITIAAQIRSGRALFSEAQSLIGEWNYQIQILEDRPIINQASDLAAEGSLTKAISVASQISPGRALYREAQELITRWQVERAEILRQRRQEEALQKTRIFTPSESNPGTLPEAGSEESTGVSGNGSEEPASDAPTPPPE